MGINTAYMRKILRTVLLLGPVILLATLFLFKNVKVDAAVTGTVTASSLFVREGPGTQYDIKTMDGAQIRLNKGDYVAVSWEENGWYYITASYNGKTINGYVIKDYISVTGAIPTGKPAATPTPIGKNETPKIPEGTTLAVMTKGFPYDGVVVATTLNIREGAGTNYSIIDTLKDGDKVTVTGVKKSTVGAYWYTVSYTKDGKTKTGITSATYVAVKVGTTKTPTPTAVPANVTLRTYGFPLDGKVVADALNVRESTSISAKRVTILLSGEKVTVLNAEKDKDGRWWYKISFKKSGVNTTGFVVSEYLSVNAPNEGTTGTGDLKYYEIPEDQRGNIYYAATVSADVLNMRDSASASGKVVAKIKQNTYIIVLERISTKSGYWYKAAARQDGKIHVGYVSSDYVSLNYDLGIYGIINHEGIALRAIPNGSAEIVTDSRGNQVFFTDGQRVRLTGETITGGEKWFKVRVDDVTEGYIIRTEVDFTGGNVSTTPPTPTPTPTPKYTATPTPTKRPAGSITPSVFPTPEVKAADSGYPSRFSSSPITGYGYVETNSRTRLMARPRHYSETVTDKRGNDIVLTSGMSLALYDKYVDEGLTYRQVRVVYNDEVYYGYVLDTLIKSIAKDDIKAKVTPTPIPDMSKMGQESFVEYMIDEGFPLSYIDMLIELHNEHPSWVFEADVTGLDWQDVIDAESKAGLNLIPGTAATGYLSTEDGAYNWLADKYVVFDSPSWVTASGAANEYFIDPRNWLDETSIFMFETLSYKSKYQGLEEVEALLQGTPFYKKSFTYTDDSGKRKTISYAQAFIDAAEYSGVSPYHLVTRVRQEIVTSSATVSNSASGTVSGYEGYYNFYNIGAYHSTTAGGAIVNGLKYAKNGTANNDEYNDASLIPWNNQYRAIVGGAYIIAQQYISRGQDTIYLQKFNVTDISTFSHQYMANIEAPKSEASKMAKAYTSPDTVVVFKIPVYSNMPAEAAKKPASKGNPNNVLSSLNVYDMFGNNLTLSPKFNPVTDTEYFVTTTEGNNVLQIVAVAVSSKATVSGNGTVVVNSNSDVFEVRVTAENGDVRIYRIYASKQ